MWGTERRKKKDKRSTAETDITKVAWHSCETAPKGEAKIFEHPAEKNFHGCAHYMGAGCPPAWVRTIGLAEGMVRTKKRGPQKGEIGVKNF